MTSMFRKHRRFLAASMLAAFVMAWVLPLQAYASGVGQAAAQTSCPDCVYPCDSGDCCGTGMAACAASMLPTVVVSAPSLDKALPAPALMGLAPLQGAPRASLPVRRDQLPAYSPPSSVNIRFCSFQE